MSNPFTVDLDGVFTKMTKKAYRLSDVKDQLETLAWDIVRFRDDDNAANLWQVQNAEDGDYIVALYDEEDLTKTASSNPWTVSVLSLSGDLQVSYKGDPLTKIAFKELGIPRNELFKVPQYLPERLVSNKKLANSLLKKLDATTKQAVLHKYPELGQNGE
jgi:hypothetical protein